MERKIVLEDKFTGRQKWWACAAVILPMSPILYLGLSLNLLSEGYGFKLTLAAIITVIVLIWFLKIGYITTGDKLYSAYFIFGILIRKKLLDNSETPWCQH